jgi:hypothetical protein
VVLSKLKKFDQYLDALYSRAMEFANKRESKKNEDPEYREMDGEAGAMYMKISKEAISLIKEGISTGMMSQRTLGRKIK